MEENRLVEIPIEDWPALRDLYENRKTESDAYNLIQNYIDWLKKDPSIDFAKFYSLNGDWSDGTFVLQECDFYIMLNTLNDSQDRLLAALNCLDKNSSYLFAGFPDRLMPTMENYFSQLGLKVDSNNLATTIWYHISQEEALKFNIDPPEGVTLSPLRQDDVDTINSIWPHRHSGSEVFIGRLIAFNPNIGAYDRDGNLLSWCLKLPIGSLGVLHVKDDHKRKGYGNLMVRVLSKKLAEMGIETTAPVVEANVPSRNMFKKLGFKEIDKVHWLQKTALE